MIATRSTGGRRSRQANSCLLAAVSLLMATSLASNNLPLALASEPEKTTQSPSITTSTSTTQSPNATTATETRKDASQNSTKVPVADLDIDEAKKAIKLHMATSQTDNSVRLLMNKPTAAPQMVDFAPDSNEAKVSEASARLGLNFMKSLDASDKENIVISPLSIQSLLNMILLGATDDSDTQTELIKALGYEATNLFAPNSADRLKPHEAMKNVFDSILAATHLSVSSQTQTDSQSLLNTNSAALELSADKNPPKDSTQIDAHLQTLNRQGADEVPLSGQVNFTLANLMLTNRDLVELNKTYEGELKNYYNINVEGFSKEDSGKSLPLHERVNIWVKNMTQNQIQELAQESDLKGQDIAMILLNAAHFKGRWQHTFNPKATFEKTFFNGGLESGATKAKFMRQKGVFGYAEFGSSAIQSETLAASKTSASEDAETLLTEDLGNRSVDKESTSADSTSDQSSAASEMSKEEAKRLELTSHLNCSVLMLPFSLNDGQELSMILMLPSKRDGIDELQAALTAPALNEVYKSLSEQQVQIEIPKFAFESSMDAKEALLKMNLKSLFLNSAKLNRMFVAGGKSNAKVDKIVHKAKIQVDESGAEAAAATMGIIKMRNFVRPPTTTFEADHPFIFIIRHNRSNMPLFMGRLTSL